MKLAKIVILLSAICVVSVLILVASYSIVIGYGAQNQVEDTAFESLLLQIHEPQENATYLTRFPPLNITTNTDVVKVTYNLNGAENITYNKDTTNLALGDVWTYNLTVYAFDAEENIIDYQTITFTVDIPHMTQQEFQEALSYFEAQGLTIMSPDPNVFRPLYQINEATISFESKEEFVEFAKRPEVQKIIIFDDHEPYVWFKAYTYPNPPFPIIYSFAVKVMGPCQ